MVKYSTAQSWSFQRDFSSSKLRASSMKLRSTDRYNYQASMTFQPSTKEQPTIPNPTDSKQAWQLTNPNKPPSTSLFQVTFWSPKWRSLNPWKGSFKHSRQTPGTTWHQWKKHHQTISPTPIGSMYGYIYIHLHLPYKSIVHVVSKSTIYYMDPTWDRLPLHVFHVARTHGTCHGMSVNGIKFNLQNARGRRWVCAFVLLPRNMLIRLS